MGDAGDFWRDIDAERKERNRDRAAQAEADFPRAAAIARTAGMGLERMSPHHCRIVGPPDRIFVIDAWPSTCRFQVLPNRPKPPKFRPGSGWTLPRLVQAIADSLR